MVFVRSSAPSPASSSITGKVPSVVLVLILLKFMDLWLCVSSRTSSLMVPSKVVSQAESTVGANVGGPKVNGPQTLRMMNNDGTNIGGKLSRVHIYSKQSSFVQ